jgi:hypothetical protein
MEWSKQGFVLMEGPLSDIVSANMPNAALRRLCGLHKIKNVARLNKESLVEALKSHSCRTSGCLHHYTVIKGIVQNSGNEVYQFPPPPCLKMKRGGL